MVSQNISALRAIKNVNQMQQQQTGEKQPEKSQVDQTRAKQALAEIAKDLAPKENSSRDRTAP